MKGYLVIICVYFISCKTIGISTKAARQIEYNNYQLTIRVIEDSIRISNLEKLVVLLPANQWIKNPDGTVTMTNQKIDTLDVKAVFVGGRPKDTITINIDTIKPENKVKQWRTEK